MNESLSFRNSKLLREVSTADAIYLRFPEHTHHPYDSSYKGSSDEYRTFGKWSAWNRRPSQCRQYRV